MMQKIFYKLFLKPYINKSIYIAHHNQDRLRQACNGQQGNSLKLEVTY